MAAQPGGSAFPDAAAVPLADGGADDRAEEVCQAGGTAGIYGMTLCKTEKIPGRCDAAATGLPPIAGAVPAMVFRQYMPWMPWVPFWEGVHQGQPP